MAHRKKRSGNVGNLSFVLFFSLYAHTIANDVKTRAELEAIANYLKAKRGAFSSLVLL